MKTLLTHCKVIKDAYSAPVEENILIDGSRITGFTKDNQVENAVCVNMQGKTAIPGFVQTHVHFCQVLFRGLADDMALLDWLRTRIWPLESCHDEQSTYLSAMLGGMELLAGGTTSVCVMESVRHAQEAARAIEELGIRAVFGKNMMDFTDTPQELGGMPESFIESTHETIENSLALLKEWKGKAGGRISYAFMPRGILTTSEELLLELKRLSKEYDVLIHTHACETIPESLLVRERRGDTEIKYLERLGLANDRLLLAHCVCVDEEDMDIMESGKVKVASCPLANLKLASGIAPISEFVKRGITVSLGSDGAPCNNNLDTFQEMKIASLLQKGVYKDPVLMPAQEIFHGATLGGAKALRQEQEVGSIEIGKKADLTFIDFNHYEVLPAPETVPTIVYSGNTGMVTDTMVDGRFVYRNKEFLGLDRERIAYQAREALKKLLTRFEGKR